jgi:hypothetical protein
MHVQLLGRPRAGPPADTRYEANDKPVRARPSRDAGGAAEPSHSVFSAAARITQRVPKPSGFAVAVAVAVALGGCNGSGGEPARDGDSATEPQPAASDWSQPDRLEPRLSYAPTCTSAAESGCMSGTEVQALETFDGKLYAGMTNWEETLGAVWPSTSAQVNVLRVRGGPWERAPALPDSPKCSPGSAPWEQVNDLHAAEFSDAGTTTSHLFAAVLANEDGACPGLHASLFALDALGTGWINTGLDTQLEAWYGAINSEVRYVETFADGTTECPAERPCLFAFVGPRGGDIGPSVWRGIYDRTNPSCRLICWDATPEVVMDGRAGPAARRIVSSASGPAGLFFGTTAAGSGRCRSEGDEAWCNRAALMERVRPGVWEPAWVGSPVKDGGPDEVRGIASWEYDDGGQSLWFVTAPAGTVYRVDVSAGTIAARPGMRSEPVLERTLGRFLPEACNARMLPYQLYVDQRVPDGASPELLVASQGCGYTPRDSYARIFHRPVARDGGWSVLDLTSVTNVGADRSNEASVRCIEASPFDDGIYFGTTDMNNTPGSLSARVFELGLGPSDPGRTPPA